jgi:uncharacterized protein (DUF433 family)
VIEKLATSGNSFLYDRGSGQFEDIGRGGQGVFPDVVRIYLERVTFDGYGAPQRWTPADGVVIDPAIQAGTPCVAGTRVPTATIAALLRGADIEQVALDLDLPIEAVEQAQAFERQLANGVGLAA